MCRWEPYDPTKSYEKYTIADAKLNFNQKAPVPVPPKVGYHLLIEFEREFRSVANPNPGRIKIYKRILKKKSCLLGVSGGLEAAPESPLWSLSRLKQILFSENFST